MCKVSILHKEKEILEKRLQRWSFHSTHYKSSQSIMYTYPHQLGAKHHRIHVWWHEPIKELLTCWTHFECKTSEILHVLRDASQGIHLQKEDPGVEKHDPHYVEKRRERKRIAKRSNLAAGVTSDTFDVMEKCLRDRFIAREGWRLREQEVMRLNSDEDSKPISVPFFGDKRPTSSSFDTLNTCAETVKEWKVEFMELKAPRISLTTF